MPPSSQQPSQQPAAGGVKKVLQTLRMARQAGWRPTAKALTANNACKACGLGMGGQKGGMTNELGEFPAVCNKSVQAQSSDLQAPIPAQIFQHKLHELRELTERELNLLGRLTEPLYKAPQLDHYRVISWPEAIDLAVQWLRQTSPQRSFFYSSGRASNEAGFILQLFARLYGTNNVNNCSYYCHQATTEALHGTVGTGTATVELADLSGCDLIFVIGANPASNHPRFIYQLDACRQRGGEVVVINPAREPGLVKFAMPKSPRSLIAGGSPVASEYLQPLIGSDIALFKGLGKAVLEMDGEDRNFIHQHTEGFAAYRNDLANTPWQQIVETCGVNKEDIERVAGKYQRAGRVVFAWGMGLTHHLHGVQNIEQVANLALLRGMLGKPEAGLLPLRGHSNVQGIGTIGVKPVLPGDVFEQLQNRLGVTLPTAPGLDTMAAMQAADAGGIDLALMMGGNLYASNPNAAWAAQALNRIACKIFLTTTLNAGHLHGLDDSEALVLPVCARDEEWQATTQESMFNYVRLSDGGITRHASVRPESHILCDLAEKLINRGTFDFSVFKNHASVRETIAATVPGMQDLAHIDVARKEFHIRNRLLHTPEFATASGKCSFRVAPLPAVDDSLFKYTLATVRSEGQFNSIVYEEQDSYRDVPTRWSVLMSPADMRKLGLSRGSHVTLRSQFGVMAAVEVFPFDLPAGNLLAYFPEANLLSGTEVDPRSRTPAFKSIQVAVQLRHHRPGRAKPPRRAD